VGGRRLSPEETVLVAAYEADKAIYEVGYEARNRPAWIEIPLAALANLDEQQAEETT
jgi:maltokinase